MRQERNSVQRHRREVVCGHERSADSAKRFDPREK
jgi:hypothetical protein